MINFCDSVSYSLSGAISQRYGAYKAVSLTSISGEQYITTSGSAVSFYVDASSHHYFSYSCDFFVSGVNTYPFNIAGIKPTVGFGQTHVSGSFAVRVNSNHSITITTPDNQRLNSTANDASVAAWSSHSGLVNVSGGLNRLAYYINLADKTQSMIYLNGRFYNSPEVPALTPTSGYGVVFGNAQGRARVLYKNIVVRAKTTGEGSFTQPLTHNWNVGWMPPSSTNSGGFTPVGFGTNHECMSGVGDGSGFIYSVAPTSIVRDNYELRAPSHYGNVGISGLQVNLGGSTDSGLTGVLMSGDTAIYQFPATTGTTHVYTYKHYLGTSSEASESPKWTQTAVDNLNLGLTYYAFALDSLSVNPKVALSVRQTRVSYTGSCMRVRRDTDNAEQDIGFVNEYVDVSAISSFVGTGNGFVATWYDQGPSGNHYYQSTALSQPKIFETGVMLTGGNGKLTLDFSSNKMLYPHSTFSDDPPASYACILAKPTANSNSVVLMSGGMDYWFLLYDAAWYIGNGATTITNPTANQYNLWMGRVDTSGSTVKRHKNGGASLGSSITLAELGTPGLGYTSFNSDFKIHEMIFWVNYLSDADANFYGPYGAYYGLTWGNV